MNNEYMSDKNKSFTNTQGMFSVVATPIGNLEDLTLRALRILKESDIVVCEDTRVTKKLLSHFDIHTPTTSFHANSGEKGFEKVIELLAEGKRIAYVCDAGTPGISDPGLELVSNVRAAGFPIETIPGASALAAALSISGLRAASFTFYGFLPHKKGRETLFKEIAASERASIFYESPHRILKALESLSKFLEGERRIGVFRELTKMYEEAIIGQASEVLKHVQTDTNKQRGEFVVIVEGR
jgi:16S rRNA (cytidine1402-2'-O)-methyltransferase